MPGLRISLTVKGDEVATAKLRALAARCTDARPVWAVVVDDILRDEDVRFRTEGYGRWKPLASSTVRRKAIAGHPRQILEASGRLRRTLTRRNMPGQRLNISAHELQFGLKATGPAYYGKFHQRGDGVKKRVVVQVRPTQRKLINGRVRAFILSGATVPHR